MKKIKTKNEFTHYHCAVDAVRVFRLKQSQGLDIDLESAMSTLETCCRFIESAEPSSMNLNGYDLQNFSNLLKDSIAPSTLAALCVQSKADLADVRCAFEALDADGIFAPLYKKFSMINNTLSIAEQMFLSIRPGEEEVI